MDHLIDELTFYSRMDSNRIPYHFEKVNAADYFADCATEVSMDLENRQIQFLQDISIADDTVILIDRQQVKRVFQNLFDNAVKYMDKPDGRITFSVFDESDEVHIRISDNGKGIAEEDLPHIFERMYRGDASRSSSVKGSGLGLAITKKIVEDHGGSISAVSGEKEGTTIDVTLKRYREDRR